MSRNVPFAERLDESHEQRRPMLIDGGLATELEAQGHNIGGDLWSARLLQTQPSAIVAAHRAFLDAGAECLIGASYQASRRGFMSLGLSADAADQLIVTSITLAAQARDEFLADNAHEFRPPLIAASVGPFGATMHDGSEYSGNYSVSTAALTDFHACRLQLLDSSDADVLACETIPSIEEAAVLCDLLRNASRPAWISFSCGDGLHISDGTPIAVAAELFRDHPGVLAVGINCTPPQFVTSLIRQVRKAVPDKTVIVYPNSGERYDPKNQSWSGTATPIEFASAAREWFDAGAQLIGGCCRISPSHIAAIAQELDGSKSIGL